MKKDNDFIPALKFQWLTKYFDFFLNYTMPEKRLKLELIKQAKLSEAKYVLDFGCGTGTLAMMIKSLHKQVRIFGVDVDKKILEIAQKKLDVADLDINLSLYDGLTLPYESKSFDKVLSSLVFHHLNREKKINALKEIYRVLKDDGELYILDFGKAPNILVRILFMFWQIFDGFSNTNDNILGLIPNIAIEAGFSKATETKKTMTFFGPLSYYTVKKLN
ncbi:MAG: methyltransferase type 11 [Clostridiales bacterium GWB2_37_7]|nr:MAG: methyltransferase type 11 [Clostridiales bacterium GWB2_37_7]